MRRVAPILLLAVLACDSASPDHVSPTMPAVATQPSAAIVPLGIELFSDEFCKGGNAWWNARFNIFGTGSLEGASGQPSARKTAAMRSMSRQASVMSPMRGGSMRQKVRHSRRCGLQE